MAAAGAGRAGRTGLPLVLVVAALLLATGTPATAAAPTSSSAVASTPPAGPTSFTLPSAGGGDKQLTFSVSGASLHPVPGAPEGTYEGTVVADRVTVTGNGTFSMGEGLVTYLGMTATLSTSEGGHGEYRWPAGGGRETVHGPLRWSQAFSISVPVTRGTTRSVTLALDLSNCGDWVCGAVGATATLTGWTPVCDDASGFFGADVAARFTKGNMRSSYDALLGQLMAAIDAWQNDAKGTATVSAGGEPVAAGLWLFSNGGVQQPDYVSRFSFGPDPFSVNGKKVVEGVSTAMQSGAFWDGTYQPYAGSEADLAQAIALQSTKEGRPLDPGAVFTLALHRTGGDARKAALLAHNTLKSLAREGTIWLTGLLPTPDFFTRYLSPLRDGDNAGVWYHTFGTLYYQLENTQSVSLSSRVVSVLGAAGAGVLYIPSWLLASASDYFAGWQKPYRFQQMLEGMVNGSLTPGREGWSTFSHGAEQAFREIFDGRDPDPEKYCFNVWGTRLAEEIRRRLVPDAPPFQIVDSTKTNPYSNVAGDTVSIDPAATTDRPDLGPGDPRYKLGYTNAFVDTLLEADGVKLFLDQQSGVLAANGDFPYPVFPYRTPTGEWGLWWVVPPGQSDPTIRFDAVADGPLHLAVADVADATIASWVTDVKAGDTVTWTPPGASGAIEGDVGSGAGTTAPADRAALGTMERGDATVAPDVLTVRFSDDGHVLVDGGRSPVLLIIGAALLFAASGAAAWFFVLRPRRAVRRAPGGA